MGLSSTSRGTQVKISNYLLEGWGVSYKILATKSLILIKVVHIRRSFCTYFMGEAQKVKINSKNVIAKFFLFSRSKAGTICRRIFHSAIGISNRKFNAAEYSVKSLKKI